MILFFPVNKLEMLSLIRVIAESLETNWTRIRFFSFVYSITVFFCNASLRKPFLARRPGTWPRAQFPVNNIDVLVEVRGLPEGLRAYRTGHFFLVVRVAQNSLPVAFG